MRARHGLFAVGLVLVGASLAAAQTPVEIPSPPPQDWRIAWEFDRETAPFPLHRFEMKVDDGTFAEIVPLEKPAETFKVSIPVMTAGAHTIYVRGCATTVCGPEVGLPVWVDGSSEPPPTDVYPRVRNLRIERVPE